MVPGPTLALPFIQPGGDSEFWASQTAVAISRLTKIVNRALFIVSPCSIRILLHVPFAVHVHGLAPRSGDLFQSSGRVIQIIGPRAGLRAFVQIGVGSELDFLRVRHAVAIRVPSCPARNVSSVKDSVAVAVFQVIRNPISVAVISLRGQRGDLSGAQGAAIDTDVVKCAWIRRISPGSRVAKGQWVRGGRRGDRSRPRTV